jgi:hypothetical protein
MQITLTERLESLKVGLLGAVGFTSVYLCFLAIDYVFLPQQTSLPATCLKIGAAALSGFLFAVTYRYVIRNDKNPHLKDGAVAAFSLVRGLVPLQSEENLTVRAPELCLFLGESFFCFLLTRYLLDLAFERGQIKYLD